MNPGRGFNAVASWTALGIAGTSLAIVVWTLGTWLVFDTLEFDRRADVAYWMEYGVLVLVGIGVYLGSAAWATYSPDGPHSFAKTLAEVFVLGMITSLCLGNLGLVPEQRIKGVEPPGVPIRGWLLLLIPPIVAAATLGWVRSVRRRPSIPREETSSAPHPILRNEEHSSESR